MSNYELFLLGLEDAIAEELTARGADHKEFLQELLSDVRVRIGAAEWGRRHSHKKAAAARRNGKKGGRPRTQK